MYDRTAAQRITLERPRDGGLRGALIGYWERDGGRVHAITTAIWPTITILGSLNRIVIQPDNWRNIGTQYQHDRQRHNRVFDTHNREVTLNGVA